MRQVSLTEEITRARERATEEAGVTIDRLAAVAARLGMRKTSADLAEAGSGLRSELFKIIVAGRFKVGKSTLLNALLGRTTRPVVELGSGQGPMPVDDLPTTATLSRISYADEPFVRMWRLDGTYEDWSLGRYLRESTVRDSEADNQAFFRDVREFEVGFPAELCQAGVVMFDSPGTSDVPQRTQLTLLALNECDAAIVVYRSDVLAGQDERDFTAQIEASGIRLFTVVNMHNVNTPTERLRRFTWDRLVTSMRNGPEYTPDADFAAYDIYFVNARAAQEAKYTRNAALAGESGLALLEERLGDFLVKERQYVHLQRYIKLADSLSMAIEQAIAQRRAGLTQDVAQLQARFSQIQPQLETIRAKPDHLPPIFERYRAVAQRELSASFELMIARLRQELPHELKRHPLLPEGGRNAVRDRVMPILQQRKLCEVALQHANALITQRLNEWSEGPAREILTRVLEGLLDEVHDEIDAIERDFAEVSLHLTGWGIDLIAPQSGMRTSDRVLWSIIGLAGGGIGGLIAGNVGGWRGAVGAVASNWVAFLVLTTLSVPGIILLPALFAIALVGGGVAGGLKIEESVRERVAEEVDQGLRGAPAEAAPRLASAMHDIFGRVEAEVMQQVLDYVDAEERNIRLMVELNRQSHEEKARALAELESAAAETGALRQALREADVRVKQTA